MTGKLEGKVAVVTGSGQSIGAAIARLLAVQGARVVVNSRSETSRDGTPTAADTAREINAAGGEALAVFADVGRMEGAKRVIDAAVERWGSLDILVNNAGGGGSYTALDALAESEWDQVIAGNLKSQYACALHALPHMRKKNWGRIVNTGSIVGLIGLPLMTAYAAAKGGVQALTLALAQELEGSGITVNCVLPSAANERNNRSRKEREARVGIRAPVNPERVPEAVAPVVACLVFPEAGGISGQLFAVAGGQIVHYRWPPTDRTLYRPTKWTLDELAPRFGRFFGEKLLPPKHPGYPD